MILDNKEYELVTGDTELCMKCPFYKMDEDNKAYCRMTQLPRGHEHESKITECSPLHTPTKIWKEVFTVAVHEPLKLKL